jgi:peptidoglycan/LPS O-acetylase OafA/YrhL
MAIWARETISESAKAAFFGDIASILTCRSLKTTVATHENNYTVIRLALAASVIFYHSFAITSDLSLQNPTNRFLLPITDMGSLAVQLFFFLSGLFVSQSYLSDPNVLRFLAKRFLRIFPGLFVCVLSTALLAVILCNAGHLFAQLTSRPFYQYVLDNSRLKMNWYIPGVFATHRNQAINGSIHTLPMEWQLYMLMGLLSVLGFLGSRRLIVSSSIVLFILAVLPLDVTSHLDFFFNVDYSRKAAALFACGMLSFAVAQFIFVPCWLPIALTLATLATHGVIHFVLFYVGALGWTLYLGEARWLTRIVHPRSDLSYGIYIYGWPMTQIAAVIFGAKVGPYALTLLALPMAICCAYGSWHLVERPALRFGHNLKALSKLHAWPGRLSLSVVAALYSLCWMALFTLA